MDLQSINNENKSIEKVVFSIAIFSANTWMTLIAPLAIGMFASKLFSTEAFTNTETVLYAISIAIHILFAIVVFVAGNRKSTSIEVDQLIEKNKKFDLEIIPKARKIFEISKTQQTVTYLMTLELEAIMDQVKQRSPDYPLNQRLRDWEEGLNRILWHLVENRTQLFDYKSDAFYNFALYLYDRKSQELIIKWRAHDDRLEVSNRSWKPGFGHVGLAFIQGEAKICQDITTSSELSNSAADKSDKKKYRSFISVPIKDSYGVIAPQTGNQPLGVLVFTSSDVGQFSWMRDKIFTLTIAKILSMYIECHVASCLEEDINDA
ncbi:GAF domain-containing protein [Pseudomonas capsici]|uniref:GAF domain-containing protein n=1 Tax=Pseudomonas capsici TaxID=2810614 RepID=UPI0021F0D011|nr:GAF domain-containing protein [Pseudomonas capsici]MCV4287751.1 GAF domain-containing protein [Pseudomonas capsici]